MATGVISELWSREAGVGGLPRWIKRGYCTFDRATIASIEKDAVAAERLKLVSLPNQRRVVAMALDGTEVRLVDIRPTNYDRTITNCVKIRTGDIAIVAPEQPSGDYSGYSIAAYSVVYQQTEDNDT